MSGLGTSAICSIVSEVCAKPLLIVFGTVMGSAINYDKKVFFSVRLDLTHNALRESHEVRAIL